MAAKVVWLLCPCSYPIWFIMTTPATSTDSATNPATSSSVSDPAPPSGTSTGGRTNSGIIPPLVPRSTTTETSLPHRLADADVQRVAQAVAQMIGRSSQNPISSAEGSSRHNEGELSYGPGKPVSVILGGGTTKQVRVRHVVGEGISLPPRAYARRPKQWASLDQLGSVHKPQGSSGIPGSKFTGPWILQTTSYGGKFWQQVMAASYGSKSWRQVLAASHGGKLWQQVLAASHGGKLWQHASFGSKSWRQVMAASFGSKSWRQVLAASHGGKLWQQVMAASFGSKPWQQAMAASHGGKPWRQVLAASHGGRLWQQAAAAGFGTKLWQQVMVEAMVASYDSKSWRQVIWQQVMVASYGNK